MSDWTAAQKELAEAAAGLNADKWPAIGRWVAQAALDRVAELERHPCAQHEADVSAAVGRIVDLERDLSAASTALLLVSGALADAGVAVGPAAEYGARVREVAAQRDRLALVLRQARPWVEVLFADASGSFSDMDEEDVAALLALRIAMDAALAEVPAPPKEQP